MHSIASRMLAIFILRRSSILKENIRGDCMEFSAQTTTVQEQNHTISILFSTYTDFVSRIIGLFSKFGCTHVSVALDDDEEHFYAFNTKGFRKEYPKKHKKRTNKNTCVKLQVTDSQYDNIKNYLDSFEKQKSKYSYDYFGVALCMFRLPKKQSKKKYFCSSFMAELLQKSKVIKLKKKNTRYLPYQLQRELLLCPLIIAITQNILL